MHKSLGEFDFDLIQPMTMVLAALEGLKIKFHNGFSAILIQIYLILADKHRALTRILKTGVQDSHLAKSRRPTGKSGSPTPKKLESHQFVHTVHLFILARSDTFE